LLVNLLLMPGKGMKGRHSIIATTAVGKIPETGFFQHPSG